jgi:gliding motility associated protien GldN
MKGVWGIICLLLVIQTATLNAQTESPQELPWQKRDRHDMRALEYEYQREADVMWSKNIWRMIDVRQKLNQPFAHPELSLIQVIHEAAKRGDITVYDPAVVNADQCTKPLTRDEVGATGVRNDTDWIISPMDGETEEQVVINNPLTWNKIIKYRVKEVWFFDTKTSSMKVRILAIAPVMEDYDAAGNYRGDMTMYWVPYASIRNLLTKNEVYNPQNDTQHFSWDDLFEMRKFESYIYKESNVFDRSINEYTAGVDAQIESERIKQEIFEKEHDMWNY